MALSSSSLQLLRTYGTSSSSVGLRRPLYRPSPSSVRLRAARVLRPVAAAASYHEEASGYAGAGDDGIAAATSVALHQVDDAAAAAELRAARTVGRAPQPPKGRPGKPKEGGGGKVHAAPTTSAAKRVPRAPAPPGLPKEGSGGQGGKIH
ncbi:PH domain leucine-rich repeat-containing protein phosphatase 1-like [Panicum miliaceum]|uniref:PH domain leucine-rich repeat-containing protein phosphatase 1-like n=1 Tax=Panicum miliaceum TaxID=4540 RepID=A0A3L6PUH6_PANMI|nr:PH domain leucine-rich repeat-containing protein phosphatase 1-like [Panicum miliaceum]